MIISTINENSVFDPKDGGLVHVFHRPFNPHIEVLIEYEEAGEKRIDYFHALRGKTGILLQIEHIPKLNTSRNEYHEQKWKKLLNKRLYGKTHHASQQDIASLQQLIDNFVPREFHACGDRSIFSPKNSHSCYTQVAEWLEKANIAKRPPRWQEFLFTLYPLFTRTIHRGKNPKKDAFLQFLMCTGLAFAITLATLCIGAAFLGATMMIAAGIFGAIGLIGIGLTKLILLAGALLILPAGVLGGYAIFDQIKRGIHRCNSTSNTDNHGHHTLLEAELCPCSTPSKTSGRSFFPHKKNNGAEEEKPILDPTKTNK